MKRFLQAQMYVLVLVLAGVLANIDAKASVINYEVRSEGQTVKVVLRDLTADRIGTVTLQKCATANDFTSIANISREELDEAGGYTFVDETPYYGNNFYRLKIESIDGDVWYSDIKYTRNLEAKIKASFYPNPSNGNFVYIKLDGCRFSEQVKVTIYSKHGAKLKEHIVEQFNSADESLQLDIIKGLHPDIYHIQVESGNQIFREKLIIS